MHDRLWDCAIVGGGPAGLTAATYLGRFLREVLVIDAGDSRIKRIPLSRNVPGFPDGVAGEDLYARMRRQAEPYGAEFVEAKVDRILRCGDRFEVATQARIFEAKTVLIATGSELIEPDIADLEAALRCGIVRYCPICDGYEARGQRIAVLGGRANSLEEAKFLRQFSDDVSFLWLAENPPTEADRQAAARTRVELAAAALVSIEATKHQMNVVYADGRTDAFDVIYPCLGCDPRGELANELGARLSDEGGILVDPHQRTNVAGLYAAGDVLQGLDQIASACGQAAIAATAIHNDLREAEDASRSMEPASSLNKGGANRV